MKKIFTVIAWVLSASLAWAQELSPQDLQALARADYLTRQRQFEIALREFGGVSKAAHENLSFRRQVASALEALYRSHRPLPEVKPALGPQPIFSQRSRVLRRKTDSDENSDKSFDNRGWQVNEHLEADQVPGRDGLLGRFVVDLESFINGHNDLRYRTLLADFFKNDSHLALGDSASYQSPFFLRGSRLRGINLLLNGELNEFQAVLGAYPFWLESRDAYIYPRTVWGMRDRYHLAEDRVLLGASVIQTRDSEKIRTIDVVNQPRDNLVFGLNQVIKVIPDVWTFKAEESASITDDNLINSRFGETTKLKGSSSRITSTFLQPWVRSKTYFERTGPDYRILADIASGGVLSSKSITVDRQFIQQIFDFEPWGPLDLDLETSWYRNNLDNDDSIGHTRQSWYTATLDVDTPRSWPSLGIRQTLYETIASPGSTTRPSQTRNYLLNLESSHHLGPLAWTAFADYEIEAPLKDKATFDEEERWSLGERLFAPVWEKLSLNQWYRYTALDEVFDEIRERGIRHEAHWGGSLALWNTASLTLGYTFLTGVLVSPAGTRMTDAEGHIGTVGFAWPYRWLNWDKRRKLSILPSLHYRVSDYSRDLEERPLTTSSLKVAYENFPDWKLELTGEFRFDDDDDRAEVRTEESRLWLLYTHRWP